jgi:hypothetical protein
MEYGKKVNKLLLEIIGNVSEKATVNYVNTICMISFT